MNEAQSVRLRDFMDEEDGWGREAGREAHLKMMRFVEAHPETIVFRLSLRGVRRIDISFASEMIVEIARRYRGMKGFCLAGPINSDQQENIHAAADRSRQPLFKWDEQGKAVILGMQPARGVTDALEFALRRDEARAAEFAAASGVSITNASNKYKQLWEQGFLLRHEAVADSGGVEFVYARIK